MTYFAALPPEQQEAMMAQSAERFARLRCGLFPSRGTKSNTVFLSAPSRMHATSGGNICTLFDFFSVCFCGFCTKN